MEEPPKKSKKRTKAQELLYQLELKKKEMEKREIEKNRLADPNPTVKFYGYTRSEYDGKLRIDIMETHYNECLSRDFFKTISLVSLKHF